MSIMKQMDAASLQAQPDASVLRYLMDIYKARGGDAASQFVDRLEQAKLCVQRDILNLQLAEAKAEAREPREFNEG